ncbi:MAG: hypothetical protein WBA74_04255, partial [Cyclobacteriaceae bacterium]
MKKKSLLEKITSNLNDLKIKDAYTTIVKALDTDRSDLDLVLHRGIIEREIGNVKLALDYHYSIIDAFPELIPPRIEFAKTYAAHEKREMFSFELEDLETKLKKEDLRSLRIIEDWVQGRYLVVIQGLIFFKNSSISDYQQYYLSSLDVSSHFWLESLPKLNLDHLPANFTQKPNILYWKIMDLFESKKYD